MPKGRFVFSLSLATVVVLFTDPALGDVFHSAGDRAGDIARRAVAPAASFRQPVSPLPAGRGPRTWPKEFYQSYSRSQDGDLEDASFTVKFDFTPITPPGGTPEDRCIQVKAKIMGDVISNHRYYRDRIASYRIWNVGNGLPRSAEVPAGITMRLPPPTPAPEPPPKHGAKSRKGEEEGAYSPVYLAIGKQPFDGELVVGCVREAGRYSGKIELKAFQNSEEKMEIPYSFEWRDGDITNMRFHMTDLAAYDPESWMGERHPRRRINRDERLERMRMRMYDSSTYPQGREAPDGFFSPRFRNPDAVRADA